MSRKEMWMLRRLLLGSSYTFNNVDKTFNLKVHFSCDSSNLLYIIICPLCGEEYTGETGVGKTKLRYRFWVSISEFPYQATSVSKTQGRTTFEDVWERYLYILSFTSDAELWNWLTLDLRKRFHEKIQNNIK